VRWLLTRRIVIGAGITSAPFYLHPEDGDIIMTILMTADEIIEPVAEVDLEEATLEALENIYADLEEDDEQLGELISNLPYYRSQIKSRLSEIENELDEREMAEADAADADSA
jgi:hypothetical protein